MSLWWSLPALVLCAGFVVLAIATRALTREAAALTRAAARIQRIAVASDEVERAVAGLRAGIDRSARR